MDSFISRTLSGQLRFMILQAAYSGRPCLLVTAENPNNRQIKPRTGYILQPQAFFSERRKKHMGESCLLSSSNHWSIKPSFSA
jgi:hypothetical protein